VPSDRADILRRLRQAPLFEALGEEELTGLAAAARVVTLIAGSTLTEEGEDADGAYLLLAGRLRAFSRRSDGKVVAVGDIAAGELVGEMALLSDAPRSASVRAVRDCRLLFFERAAFDRLVHTNPEATLAIATLLVERLRRADQGRRSISLRQAIALVPREAGRRADLDDLTAALARLIEVEIIDTSRITEALGQDPADADIQTWLQRLEGGGSLIVYIADDFQSPWGKRCLSQADHIVVFDTAPGRADDKGLIATLGKLSTAEVGPGVDAVCVQDAGALLPIGGAQWVRDDRMRVHHVRGGRKEDYERVARIITRRDVALVLSGGGARGIAHLGVIKAFEELDVPIDVVGGTSFGSIAAVMRAIGMSEAEMRDVVNRGVGKSGALIDLTAPAMALTKGARLLDVLRGAFGDAALEDVWLRCFCISSNLTTARPQMHVRGNAVAAVRASVAIPGVFPPVATADGDLLVDGSIMNNLPVDVMAEFADGGPLVAVNLRSRAHLAAGDLSAEGVMSGWRLLLNRFLPFRDTPEVPSLMALLARATETGSSMADHVLEQAADYVLHPPVSDFGPMDFTAIDDLIEAGYRYTMEELASWADQGRPINRVTVT